MIWHLLWTFFMIGFVSFGGGYAMIPVIEHSVVETNGWMTSAEFSDVVSVAGMSPGPIATNIAVFVGYRTAGLAGAAVSAFGIVLPSLVLVVLVSLFFYKYHANPWVESMFYELRPIIVALVFYGAYRLGVNNGYFGSLSPHTVFAALLFAGALYALFRLKMAPIYVILLSGLIGIAVYS